MRQLAECVPSASSFRCAGDIIKYTRIKLGFSQRYVASKADMSPSALCKIESGKRMQPRNVMQLSDVLKLTPQDLLSFHKKQLSPAENFQKMKELFPHDWKSILKEGIKDLI